MNAVNKSIKFKILTLLFMSACWFVPYAVFSADNLDVPLLNNAVIAVSAVFAAVALFCLIKNKIFGLAVLLLVSTGLAIADYRSNFGVIAALIAIYVYINPSEEKTVERIFNTVLSAASLAMSIIGSLINCKDTLSSKYLITDALPSFAVLEIFFAGLLIYMCKAQEFSDKKEKSRNIRSFAICIFGVLCSFLSSNAALNNGVAFYPWLMFVYVMIVGNDQCLFSLSDRILGKTKAFLGV